MDKQLQRNQFTEYKSRTDRKLTTSYGKRNSCIDCMFETGNL